MKSLAAMLGLALAVGVVYQPVTAFEFVNYDDPFCVDPPEIRAGLNAASITWAFKSLHFSNWSPLTWISLMADAQIYGRAAGGYHRTNVVLHIGGVWFLFLAFHKMTGSFLRSLLLSAIYALHPLHVESVAWVAERKGILSTFFALLTLLAYAHYVARPTLGRYLLVFLSLACGLLAKQMLVTLPFGLLLLDIWPLRRMTGIADRIVVRRCLVEKAPMFLVIAGFCVMAYVAQDTGGALPSLEKYPLGVRIKNAILSYVLYLDKFFRPRDLSVFYPHPQDTIEMTTVLGCLALLSILTVGALWLSPKRPWLAVGWLWYLGTLLPVSGIIQIGNHGMADRYGDLPLLGITWALVWTLPRAQRPNPLWLRLQAAGYAVVLAGMMYLSRNQVMTWKNSVTLFETAVANTNASAITLTNLATAYYERNRFAEAERAVRKALEYFPEEPKAMTQLGLLLVHKQQWEEAIKLLHRVLEIDPTNHFAHNNLGMAHLGQNHHAEAIAEFQKAIAIGGPVAGGAHANLGLAQFMVGRYDDAYASLQKALAIQPENAKTWLTLGAVQEKLGRKEEELAAITRAVELRPNDPMNHLNLGIAQQNQGLYRGAVRSLQRANELEKDSPRLLAELALLLATCPDASLRDGKQAKLLAQRSVEKTGGKHLRSVLAWAAAAAELGDFAEAGRLTDSAIQLAKELQADPAIVSEQQRRKRLFENRQPLRLDRPTNQ